MRECLNYLNNLGEWLLENGYAQKEEGKAVIWPEEASIAKIFGEQLNYRVAALSSSISQAIYQDIEEAHAIPLKSHEFAELEQVNRDIDLEYGWALSADTSNSLKEGYNLEDSMRKIANTSEKLLADNAHAVYNLECIGSSYNDFGLGEQLGVEEKRLKYARTFQDLIKEEYSDNVELHQNLEFSRYPHLTWRK